MVWMVRPIQLRQRVSEFTGPDHAAGLTYGRVITNKCWDIMTDSEVLSKGLQDDQQRDRSYQQSRCTHHAMRRNDNFKPNKGKELTTKCFLRPDLV